MTDVYFNRKLSIDDDQTCTQASTNVDQPETPSSFSDEQIGGQRKDQYLSLVNGIVNASNNKDFYTLNQILVPLLERRNVALLNSICALHWCCYSGHLDLINKLIDAGCDPFLPDPINYESPVYYAIKGSNPQVISILLKNFGPLILCHENRKSKTPFMVAVSEFTDENIVPVLHVLEFLYLSGVSLEEQDCNGTTPLMFACKRGQLFVVQWLLKKGADISHRDHYGATVMHYAVLGSCREVVRFLAQNGLAQMAHTKAVSTSISIKPRLDQSPLQLCTERAAYSQYYLLLIYWYQWNLFGRVIVLTSLYPVVFWIMSILNVSTFYKMCTTVYDSETGFMVLLGWMLTFFVVQIMWIKLKISDPGVSVKTKYQASAFSPTNNDDLTPFEKVLDSLHKRQQLVNFDLYCIKMDMRKQFLNKTHRKKYARYSPWEYGNEELLEPLNGEDEEDPFSSRVSACKEELDKIKTEMRSVYPQVASERCNKNAKEYNNAVLNFEKTGNICLTCCKPRAVREHHCGICNTCVVHQDHHCDWLNNCIAAKNQKMFTIFLFLQVYGFLEYFRLAVKFFLFKFRKDLGLVDVLMLVYATLAIGPTTVMVIHLFLRILRSMVTDVTYYEYLRKPNYTRARYRGNVHERFWEFKNLSLSDILRNVKKFWTFNTKQYEEEIV